MSGANFFEFREKLVARRSPPATTAPAASASRAGPRETLTVSQLTAIIDGALRLPRLESVLVKGEVSNLNHHKSSGHLYFTMKDKGACVDCVMFRSDNARLKFRPADGQELLAGGRIGVYAQRGKYQLYVTSLAPLGKGALEAAFQELRRKLEAEGLFARERKLPLPRYPRTIALVTSRETAALQDMLKVLRRSPWLRVLVYHVAVQGDGAGNQIAAAIGQLNRMARAKPQAALVPDVIVLARGGGSLEDLWEFNQEAVARAVARSEIPIVTGIGHEVDTSIADLAADHHAHTPTEAAQVIVQHWRTARDAVDLAGLRLRRGLLSLLQTARARLLAIERHEVFRRPTDRINQLRQSLDDRQRSLTLAVGHRLRAATARVERLGARFADCHPRHLVRFKRQRVEDLGQRLRVAAGRDQLDRRRRLEAVEAQLRALSPDAVLRRGYTITTARKTGAILRSAGQVKPGDTLVTRFPDGQVESVAEDRNQPKLFE